MAYSEPANLAQGDVLPESWVDDVRLNQIDHESRIAAREDRPRVRVYNSGSQTVAPSLAVLFNSEDYDTDGMHSTSTNTGRLTAVTAGIYTAGFNGRLQAIAAGAHVDTWLEKNGTAIAYDRRAKSGGSLELVQIVTTVELAVDDYLTVGVAISTGSKSLERSSDYSPIFWANWIGEPS